VNDRLRILDVADDPGMTKSLPDNLRVYRLRRGRAGEDGDHRHLYRAGGDGRGESQPHSARSSCTQVARAEASSGGVILE